MATLKEQLDAALKRAAELKAKAASDDGLTEDEIAEVGTLVPEIDNLKSRIKSVDDSNALLARLGAGEADEEPEVSGAKSLGEHFRKTVGGAFVEAAGRKGATVTAPAFKAPSNTDTVQTGGASGSLGAVLTEVDRTVVQGFRRPLVIADLFGSGTVGPNTQAITYFVEGDVLGDFATVAEGGQKPQMSFTLPTAVTDPIRKIAAWWDETDEMRSDLDYIVSQIDSRARYLLALKEEAQLLSGNGSGTNIKGLLSRNGVQSVSSASAADNADAVFRAMTAIQTATGLAADGIAIHPLDYQTFRLSKDGNGQYFGGGYFSGQYGNGGVALQPPLWGLRTVVTTAAPLGTPVLGAWKAGGTVYRKGGVEVATTNSDGSKFTQDITTVRIEERIGLAVRIPTAFAKVILASAGSGSGSDSGSGSASA